jgi:hypothetical protein
MLTRHFGLVLGTYTPAKTYANRTVTFSMLLTNQPQPGYTDGTLALHPTLANSCVFGTMT